MKKTAPTIASLVLIASVGLTEARCSWNVSFGNRPYGYARPVYYVQEPVCYTSYYPAYQSAIVHYVDNREPEVALMQDGFNMMFDAMSHSSRASKHSQHKR